MKTKTIITTMAMFILISSLVYAADITAQGGNLVVGGRLTGDGSIPVGMISMFNRVDCPSGWHIADGTDGYIDLRDRFIVGAGSSYALGSTGGASTVALTIANLASHTHTQNAHNHLQNAHNHLQNRHRHLVQNQVTMGAGAYSVYRAAGDWIGPTSYTTATNIPATATNKAATAVNQNTGGGAAHENKPPYVALIFCVKT